MTFTKCFKFVSTLWTFFLIATVAQAAIVANVSSPTSSAGLDIYTINITGDAAATCVIARSEGCLDTAVFTDPAAGLTSSKEPLKV